MANLTFVEKMKLEQFLGMRSGGVLDLSHKTLSELVFGHTGKDLNSPEYDFASGSKANRLRAFWEKESDSSVSMLLDALLEYWRFKHANEISDLLYAECIAVAKRLKEGTTERTSSASGREEDAQFAALAVAEARKSVAEDDKPHPKVGAIAVRDGRVLAVAHRGEMSGCHAEYILLGVCRG